MKIRRLSIALLGLLAVACPRAEESSRVRPSAFTPRLGVAELTPSGAACLATLAGPKIKLQAGATGFAIAAHNACPDNKIAIKALARYPLKDDGTPNYDRPQEFVIRKAFECVGDDGATMEDPFELKNGEHKILYCRAREHYESETDRLRAGFKFCAAVAGGTCATDEPFTHELEIIVLP